jgi:hypothetical protein
MRRDASSAAHTPPPPAATPPRVRSLAAGGGSGGGDGPPRKVSLTAAILYVALVGTALATAVASGAAREVGIR